MLHAFSVCSFPLQINIFFVQQYYNQRYDLYSGDSNRGGYCPTWKNFRRQILSQEDDPSPEKKPLPIYGRRFFAHLPNDTQIAESLV